MTSNHRGSCVTALLLVWMGLGAAASAQQPIVSTAGDQPSQAGAHLYEGDWVRTDTHGARDFGGLDNAFAAAQLTPAGAAALASARASQASLAPLSKPHEAGKPYIVVDKPCSGTYFAEGGLGVNPDSGAIHIIESKYEFVIAPERSGIRTIYLDGRAHPDLSLFTPTPGGHGVGHYEADAFIVDTVGLTARAVPADGWRTPETHLAERFSLSADGKHMTIHYTYSDPKIYVKPHSFEYTFDRLPAGSYALEEWCDASDPKERESVVPPPQD
jgi:hypothetical protein